MSFLAFGSCMIVSKLLTALDDEGRQHFWEEHSQIVLCVGGAAIIVGVMIAAF